MIIYTSIITIRREISIFFLRKRDQGNNQIQVLNEIWETYD